MQNWAFADNVLQANEGPSFVAHQYYIAAQSGGLPGSKTAPDAEAENPRATISTPSPGDYTESVEDAQGDVSGCDPNNEIIKTINMLLTPPPQSPGPLPDLDNGQPFSPACENYNTILDEIEAQLGYPRDYDWQYIATTEHNIWATPLGVQHLYNAYESGNKATEPFAVDPDAENFVLNITGSASPSPARPFASLTYITPCFHESDHPAMSGTDDGPAWLAWVLNAIGRSKYWSSTAIFVTWDDWGGWYDKVPPVPTPGPVRPFPNSYNNPKDPNEWGFRVRLMIISPYVKQRGYISNPTNSFQYRSQSVMLQFIEHVFNLPRIGGDEFQQGQIDELIDAFNFHQSPLPHKPLPTNFVPGQVGDCPGGSPSYRRKR